MALMIGIAGAWYTLVVFTLTTSMMASVFQCVRRWVDRVAGIAIMSFGATLSVYR